MSECDSLADLGVRYVRVHQRHSGDRVAELLEPFVGRDGNWPQRLSFIMQRAQLDLSRRLFELFLRLIDEGTLDSGRGPIAANSTFWSMLHNLETRHPDWIAEVLAHWLHRRLAIARQTRNDGGQPNWHILFNYDEVGPEVIETSAAKSPEAFAQHVLPTVLKIADEASAEESRPAPKRDAVWSTLFWEYHSSMDQACINAVSAAVEQLAESRSESIESILGNLRQHTTYTANFLLLRAYAAGAGHFADEAISLLCNETWRFECGYSNSPIWVSMQLVGAVVRHCTDDNRKKLEQAILTHIPLYERSPYGHKDMGRHSYGLLSSIPAELRSDQTQARFLELERKFGSPESPPERMQTFRVGSPIQGAAAEKMTDEQWLRAIAKYDTEEGKNPWEHPEQGGALELARTLREFAKQDPERFARLSLRFPSGTHPYYMEHTLRGLKGAKGDLELKLEVCRKAYHGSREDCGMAIAALLGSTEEPLPEEAVQMLSCLATWHPDPNQELGNKQATGSSPYFGGDILTHGINTTRGRTAWAITDLILHDVSYIQRFRTIVEHLVNDYSIAVRACAATTLLAIVNTEPEFAIEQFLKLVESRGDPTSDDRLLTTRDAKEFLNYGIYQHFDYVRPVIKRMLQSDIDETSEKGAWFASIAALLGHEEAGFFVEEACRGNATQRLGVAQVAAANIGRIECRQWSEEKLLQFFDDTDPKVCQEAGSCFRNLKNQSLETYENLISRFCDSAAYHENSFHLLSALDHSSDKLPGITLLALQRFSERFGAEANDIHTSRSIDGATMAKLILRTYYQHQHDQWAAGCLDLMDQMCLEGSNEIRSNLESYER